MQEGGGQTGVQARAYFVKLLRKVSSKKGVQGGRCDVASEVINRLRDAQLLLYAQSVLDSGTLDGLCSALMQDSAILTDKTRPCFSVDVAFSLEMVRGALEADDSPDED
jgi:hypothetical protein